MVKETLTSDKRILVASTFVLLLFMRMTVTDVPVQTLDQLKCQYRHQLPLVKGRYWRTRLTGMQKSCNKICLIAGIKVTLASTE